MAVEAHHDVVGGHPADCSATGFLARTSVRSAAIADVTRPGPGRWRLTAATNPTGEPCGSTRVRADR